MTIDTKIRHVTKPGANLFLELGFPAEEAAQLTPYRKRKSTTPGSSRNS